MALKSYEYRVICDVCRSKLWNFDLRLRWDGLMTCKDCWETRHPIDFYRGRSDAHLLPFTRSDVEAETVWTHATLNGISTIAASGETFLASGGQVLPVDGVYVVQPTSDNINTAGKTTGRITLVQWINSVDNNLVIREPKSSTTGSGFTTINWPTTPGGAGTYRVMTSFGKLLLTGTISGASSTLSSWSTTYGHLFLSFSYLT